MLFAHNHVVGDPQITYVHFHAEGDAVDLATRFDRVLAVCNPETKIIPGHGAAVSDCAALKAYRDMIVVVRGRVQKGMKAGKRLDAIKAAKPTAEYDATHRGSIAPDDFVTFVYRSLGGT